MSDNLDVQIVEQMKRIYGDEEITIEDERSNVKETKGSVSSLLEVCSDIMVDLTCSRLNKIIKQ